MANYYFLLCPGAVSLSVPVKRSRQLMLVLLSDCCISKLNVQQVAGLGGWTEDSSKEKQELQSFSYH